MRTIFLLILSIFTLALRTATSSETSIVFVHIGANLPTYLKTAVAQARLFNPDCSIFIIGNEQALNNLPPEYTACSVKTITCESLAKTESHKRFIEKSILDRNYRDGFWSHATERLFYLDDFMLQYQMENVVHLENDVMLYMDLEEAFPIFQRYYKNLIGAVFDNDARCIPSFLYISTAKPLHELAEFISLKCHRGGNDMEYIAQFKKFAYKKFIDHLPITLPSYTATHPFQSLTGRKTKQKQLYYNHFDLFNSIFDGAALGQYLGGIDPRNDVSKPGFINESCLFNPSHFTFEMQPDSAGRLVPYALFQGQRIRINNLHIHSKNLEAFFSLAKPEVRITDLLSIK